MFLLDIIHALQGFQREFQHDHGEGPHDEGTERPQEMYDNLRRYREHLDQLPGRFGTKENPHG